MVFSLVAKKQDYIRGPKCPKCGLPRELCLC